MIKKLEKGFAFIGIMLFVGAFFWVGDVYTYLDQHFWHLDDIPKQKTIPLTYFFLFWPLSWIVAFIASAIPFFAIGFISMHFEYKEIKQKEQTELELEKAKRASNLYINTNRMIGKFVPVSIQTLCANNGFKIKPEHISHIEIDRAGGLLRLEEDISIWDEKILRRNSMKYPDDYVKCVNCGEEFPRGARCSNKLHTALASIGKRNTI